MSGRTGLLLAVALAIAAIAAFVLARGAQPSVRTSMREQRRPDASAHPPARERSPMRSESMIDGAARGADSAAQEPVSEAALMQAAHDALERDPERALELVETADRRFGDAHEERRVLEIEALVRLQRIGLSHARASSFYRRFPRSPNAREVERLTGYHPRPPGHE